MIKATYFMKFNIQLSFFFFFLNNQIQELEGNSNDIAGWKAKNNLPLSVTMVTIAPRMNGVWHLCL